MHKDKMALVRTLRSYRKHILGHLFCEAADTIEEQLQIADALERDNDQLCAKIKAMTNGDACPIEAAANKPRKGTWDYKPIENDPLDPIRLFKHRYYCSECGNWNSYGMTAYCPKCGAEMEGEDDAETKKES